MSGVQQSEARLEGVTPVALEQITVPASAYPGSATEAVTKTIPVAKNGTVALELDIVWGAMTELILIPETQRADENKPDGSAPDKPQRLKMKAAEQIADADPTAPGANEIRVDDIRLKRSRTSFAEGADPSTGQGLFSIGTARVEVGPFLTSAIHGVRFRAFGILPDAASKVTIRSIGGRRP